MQITETLNSGLKREIKVKIPACKIEEQIIERLSRLRDKVRIKGFRPGKIPLPHLRKMHGHELMAEVVNETLSESTRTIIAQRSEIPAMQPHLSIIDAEKTLQDKKDLEFVLSYEVIPSITIRDLKTLSASRLICNVEDCDVESEIKRISEVWRSYELCGEERASIEGDQIIIDYVGKIDGTPFEGGSASDQKLIIGSCALNHGFETSLSGLKSGEEKDFNVTLPSDYFIKDFSGRSAVFSVRVVRVEKPSDLEVNDDLAKKFGLQSLSDLRDKVREGIQSEYNAASYQKLKRCILDQLDSQYDFELPVILIEAEFRNIWNQLLEDLKQEGRSFSDEGTTQEAVHAEYQNLAKRRVKLGLVLGEIGKNANLMVTEEELRNGLIRIVNDYPPNERKDVFESFRSNANALASLRAVLFEEKVVSHILKSAALQEKKVSKEELMASDDDDHELLEKKSQSLPKKKAQKKEKENDLSHDEVKKKVKSAAPKKNSQSTSKTTPENTDLKKRKKS